MVLLSITPLLDGVLRRDIIAPFHTSGPPLLQFHLAIEQWGKSTSTGEYVTHTFPIKFTVIPIVVAGALTSNTSGNTGSQSNPCYRSITVSNFVFCMYDNARGYAGSTYIAIGY